MKTKIHFLEKPGFLASLLLAALLLLPLLTTTTAHAQKSVGSWEEIYSGVWYATGSNSSPLQKVYALRIDTLNPSIKFKATPGNGGSPGQTTRQTTLSFRNAHNLRVGINANYYQVVGSGANIEGLLISDGNLVSGGGSYGYRPAQLRITSDNVATLVDSTATPGGVHTAIAGSGFPLLAGNPLGENSEYHPRTGLGITNGGRYIIMVVIDGRQPGYSNGATTLQLGQWLKDFGAWNGMMLDGGGSSTLVAEGQTKNSPSDGSARLVGANFGAFAGSIGFEENVAMAVDGDERVWFAHVKTNGHVNTRRYDPSTNTWETLTQHGTLDNVSQRTRPAIVVRENGDVRLFAMTTAGNLFTRTRTLGSGWGSWSNLGGGFSIEAGPSAVVRTSGRISVAAIRADGALRIRTWIPGSGWGSWFSHGSPTWSLRASPCLIAGTNGILHMLAVKEDGRLFSLHLPEGGSWSNFVEHGSGDWSNRGGIGGVAWPSGSVSFAAVKEDRQTLHRSWNPSSGWGSFTSHGNDWSRTSAPALAYSDDRFWIFGVKINGTIYGRNWKSGQGWSSWQSHGSDWSLRVGASAIGVPGGSIYLARVKADGGDVGTLFTRRGVPSGGNVSWQSSVGHGDGWVK